MDEADDARISVVRAALRSRAWRSLPAEEVVRVLLAARDRHRVEVLLGDLAGTTDGGWQDLSPVDATDIRVAPLIESLTGQPWRDRSLTSLVPELLAVLDRWWFRWQWRLGDEAAPADDA